MAERILNDPFISIAANDLSSSVKEISIEYEAELQDDTTGGDTTRSNLPGLLNWQMTITFAQDFAASQLDSILFPLVGTVFDIEVRPTVAPVGTSNPKYTAGAVLENYSPIGQSMGDFVTAPVTLKPAKSGGTAATLVRATA